MKTNKQTIARILLSLMLTVAMVMPMAAPAEVYAAKESTEASSQAASTNQYISGINAVFAKKVLSDERLNVTPENLKAAGKMRSIKLTWSAVPSADGYYVLRKKKGKWYQIATVSSGKTSYTDKKAKTKNKYYRYSVIAYKKVDGKIMVSGPAGWAGALTTRSREKNVYEAKVSNPANVVSVSKGSCAQIF